jgi:hypothetical protein
VDLAVPFSVAFYVLFGKQVSDFSDMGRSFVSIIRMTVVDMDYDALHTADSVMAPILTVAWLFLSAILLLNLLVAMLSNSYQLVSDNAHSVAAMQRLAAMLAIEDGLSDKQLQWHRVRVHNNGQPQKMYFDDEDSDTTNLARLRQEILSAVNSNARQTEKIESKLEDLNAAVKLMMSKKQTASSSSSNRSGAGSGGDGGRDGGREGDDDDDDEPPPPPRPKFTFSAPPAVLAQPKQQMPPHTEESTSFDPDPVPVFFVCFFLSFGVILFV